MIMLTIQTLLISFSYHLNLSQMKKLSTLLFAIILGTLFIAFKQINDSPLPPTLKTEDGLVSGVKSSAGEVMAFKGIPFAAPPIGNLRWKAPQPAIHWEGVRKCDAFGPSPMQPE